MQAVAGALVKRVYAQQRRIDAATVYHIAIMPCFDKKLEATRPDLAVSSAQLSGTVPAHSRGGAAADQDTQGPHGKSSDQPAQSEALPETDCVLATNEVQALLQHQGVQLEHEQASQLDRWLPVATNGHCAPANGETQAHMPAGGRTAGQLKGIRGGSGGYMEHTLRYAARELYGMVRYKRIFRFTTSAEH